MGLFDFLKKTVVPSTNDNMHEDVAMKLTIQSKTADSLESTNEGNNVKKTAGTCCICGRKLFRHPDQADRLDNAARYCRECGTDICVFCMQEHINGSKGICPVCGKNAWFEINPLFRPK